MVQTFSPYGTDHTLHKRSLPRTPPSPKHFLDLHDGDLLAKRMAINSISIPQQILRCEVKREGFQDLMRCPLCGRMSRYVEVHDTSPIMSHHDEDEQYLEQRRRHREKIDGGQLCRVILQKRPPGLRRWLPMPDHVFGDGSFRNLDTQLEKFTTNSRRSQIELFRLRVRINSRVSFATLGLPTCPCRTFQVQYQRNPRRCQSTTVVGFTIKSAERHRGQH